MEAPSRGSSVCPRHPRRVGAVLADALEVSGSTVCRVTQDVPAPLAELVFAWPWTRQAWERLSSEDRRRYCEWVAGARSPAAARRRAQVAYERVVNDRRWAGRVRRTFDRYLALPKGTTTDEARQADAGDGWAGWHPW
jgi:hypothetical protein